MAASYVSRAALHSLASFSPRTGLCATGEASRRGRRFERLITSEQNRRSTVRWRRRYSGERRKGSLRKKGEERENKGGERRETTQTHNDVHVYPTTKMVSYSWTTRWGQEREEMEREGMSILNPLSCASPTRSHSRSTPPTAYTASCSSPPPSRRHSPAKASGRESVAR